MGVSDTTEADWEEYYRNVNAFNIPNADAKRVEIWDKAFLSTKTVRETLWEVYSKGFMDGTNDTSERFKSSTYKQEYDFKLLDKVAEKIKAQFKDMQFHTGRAWFDFDAGIDRCTEKIDKVIAEMKANIKE